MKRKICRSATARRECSSSRKVSAIVSATCPTRNLAPGGSFIWTEHHRPMFSATPASFHFTVQASRLRGSRFANPAENAPLPFCLPTICEISSVNNTVFATPGTTEQSSFRPARAAENIDTLIPVEKFRLGLTRRDKGGGSRCRSRLMFLDFLPKSIVFQHIEHSRSKTRHRRVLFSGPPVSSTVIPLASPCASASSDSSAPCGVCWISTFDSRICLLIAVFNTNRSGARFVKTKPSDERCLGRHHGALFARLRCQGLGMASQFHSGKSLRLPFFSTGRNFERVPLRHSLVLSTVHSTTSESSCPDSHNRVGGVNGRRSFRRHCCGTVKHPPVIPRVAMRSKISNRSGLPDIPCGNQCGWDYHTSRPHRLRSWTAAGSQPRARAIGKNRSRMFLSNKIIKRAAE